MRMWADTIHSNSPGYENQSQRRKLYEDLKGRAVDLIYFYNNAHLAKRDGLDVSEVVFFYCCKCVFMFIKMQFLTS